MLEDAIKQLCKKTRIRQSDLIIKNDKDAEAHNNIFTLSRFITTELENISVKCGGRDYMEIDITADLVDESYLIEIRIKSHQVVNLRNLMYNMKSKNELYETIKKRVYENASICDDPSETQIMIPIEKTDQVKAADFIYELFSFRNAKAKKEEKLNSTNGNDYKKLKKGDFGWEQDL